MQQIPVLDRVTGPQATAGERTFAAFQEIRERLEETLVTLDALRHTAGDREDWASVHQAAQVATRAIHAAVAAIPGAPFDDRVAAPRELAYGELRIDVPARQGFFKDRPIKLSRMEFGLLVALAREPTRVYTKAELLRDVWGYRRAGITRTLDSHAARLRRKLVAAGAWPGDYVVSLWGVGYALSRAS